MEKDRVIIRNCDNIEIDGRLYLIPDKYTGKMDIPIEYKALFNYILAEVMHARIRLGRLEMETMGKSHMDRCLVSAEKMLAFIITGKLDNVIFAGWERDILAGIPGYIIPKLNPFIVERLD